MYLLRSSLRAHPLAAVGLLELDVSLGTGGPSELLRVSSAAPSPPSSAFSATHPTRKHHFRHARGVQLQRLRWVPGRSPKLIDDQKKCSRVETTPLSGMLSTVAYPPRYKHREMDNRPLEDSPRTRQSLTCVIARGFGRSERMSS